MPNKPGQIDLSRLFASVAATMASNRESLNQADDGNHNHGDNMVEIFNLISQTLKSQRRASPAEQLMEASRVLSQQKSGSAQVYAQGLQRASSQFQGQKFFTPENIMMLIQLLMGLTQQRGASTGQGGIGDLLGTLLGGAQPAASGGYGAPQGGSTGGSSPGLDLGDLLSAGAAFMGSRQRGGDDMTALINALSSGSAMSGSSHRAQSGALVVNTVLQALSAMQRRKQ